MKTISLTTLLLIVSAALFAQVKATDPWVSDVPPTITGTSRCFVVFNQPTGKPVKVYQMVEDCINFVYNQPYYYQDKELYYRLDTTRWQVPNAWAIEDLRQPTPLADKYLATKDVYVALDTAINVVIKVFDTEEDGKVYVKKFPMPLITLPYYHRTAKSYEQIHLIQKKRLGIK